MEINGMPASQDILTELSYAHVSIYFSCISLWHISPFKTQPIMHYAGILNQINWLRGQHAIRSSGLEAQGSSPCLDVSETKCLL